MEREQFLMETVAKQYYSLRDAVSEVCGEDVQILRRDPVSGGDINRAYMLSLSDGNKLFMKENDAEKLDFFTCEVEGLQAIRMTGAISVPGVYGYGTEGDRTVWWIPGDVLRRVLCRDGEGSRLCGSQGFV